MHAARVDQQTGRAVLQAAAAIDNSINASIQFSRVTNHSILQLGQLPYQN